MFHIRAKASSARSLARSATPAVALLLCIALSAPAHADSDGYFCAGPDYLAYQFAFSHGRSKHELTIVSLRDGATGTTVLPFFQPHGMRCTEATVEMKGWKEIHRIDVSDRRKPAYRGKTPETSKGAAGYDQQNLGLWPTVQGQRVGAGETVIPVGINGGPKTAQLRLRIRESRIPGGLKRDHVTDLLLSPRPGGTPIVKRLFTGSFDEPIH